MTVPATPQSRIAAARSIVRSLYALSRYVRLFGLGHSRTSAQLASTYAQIRELIPPSGLAIDVTDDRLTCESIALEVGAPELSFLRFLRETQQTTFQFNEQFTPTATEDIVSSMAFDLSAIRRVGANTNEPDSGGAEDQREWLRDPASLLYSMSLAEDATIGATSAEDTGDPQARLAGVAPEEIAQILHLMGKLGNSTAEDVIIGAGRELQRVPSPLLNLFHKILVDCAELEAPPSGNGLLLRVADQLVIRFVLAKLEDGDITAAQVPGFLERLGRQLITLRSVLPEHPEKVTRVTTLEPHLEALERELWNAAPDAVKRVVLLFDTPFYVPAACINLYLERMIANGEELVAATILKNYGAAVDGRDAEGRRRSAMGIPELAELYALVVPDYVPRLVRSVSRQLMRESDVRMQSLLSAALIRLSYAVQQQRDFASTAATSDALEEITHRRPVLGMELRPRISVESRLPEYIDEALMSPYISNELLTLLQRHAIPVTDQLCARFLDCSLHEESARLTKLAAQLGADTHAELLQRLRSGNSEDALGAVGLLSSLSPVETSELLPRRILEWNRVQQDLLIRQLGIASSPQRGRLLLRLLPNLDTLMIPGALDEIGMSGDPEAASTLIGIATAKEGPRFSAYCKVKAIEALGRLSAAKAIDSLKELLRSRKLLRWAQPRELRIAALQALYMIDPEQGAHFVLHSGITKRELSLGPLAIDAENPWARQRRYRRVFPLKPMTAVTTSTAGKTGLDIVALSLGGGRARRQGKMQPGSDVTLHLQVALRKLDSQVLVREVTGNEISFEIADIGLADRSKLRQLLLSQVPPPVSPQASRAAA